MNPKQEFDLFLSYAHADAEPVQRLVEGFRTAGLSVWHDDSDVFDFQSITRAIRDGVARSRALLAYYSATYPTRRACQWELTSAFLAASQEGDPRRRILVLNPEAEAGHLHPVELRDALFRTPPGGAAEIEATARSVSEHVAGLDGRLGEVGALEQPRWYGTTPVASSRFVGRLRQFWELHSALRGPAMPIITGTTGPAVAKVRGLGGIGKSLLVEEYALRYAAAYPGGVFWLRAFGNDDAKGALSTEEREAERDQQFRGFAEELGLDVAGAGPTEVRGVLAAKLGELEPSLWVVDDLPSGLDSEAFRGWLAPHPKAVSVITTRSRDYESLGEELPLDVLAQEEAVLLLASHRQPETAAEEAAAEAIVEDLGRHALAVEVAGADLAGAEGLVSFAEFRASLNDPHADALELAAELGGILPSSHERSIASTLLKSIEQLEEEGRDFLRLASALAVAPIPATLVQGTLQRADALEEGESSRRARRALAQVDRLSLTEVGPEGMRSVHTLVSRTMRFHDTSGQRTGALRAASVEALAEVLEAAADVLGHRRLKLEVTHARELRRRVETEADARLVYWLGRHDYDTGAYASSESLLRTAFEARRRLLGDEHPDTLVSLNDLASTLKAQSDFDGARKLEEAVLEARRRLFGDEHPDTLTSLNNLAVTLKAQGNVGGAHKLEEAAFEARRRLLGDEHPDTLTSMVNVATTLWSQGDFDGARKLQESVLKARRRLLGDEHPDTLTCMNNLASTLSSQGDLGGARKLEEAATEARRRLLGDEHPKTLTSMSNLAMTLKAQGDFDGARKLEETVLEARRHRLGDEHPDTTISAWNYFATLRSLGRAQEGERLLKRDLLWLLSRDPAGLGADQRTIREMLEQVLKGVELLPPS